MNYYSQRDARWKDKLLGDSGLTMGGFGCAVADEATMLSLALKRDITPGEMCDYNNGSKYFTKEGNLLWDSVRTYSKGTVIFAYSSMFNLDIWRRKYCLRQLVYGKFLHFVLEMPGGRCYDPWSGSIVALDDKRWGKTLGRRWFYIR